MPAAAARKPAGAKEAFALSKGQKQCGTGALVLAVIIGLSAYFSPDSEAVATPGKPAPAAVTSLDDASFDKMLAAHPDGILIDFYSKSCKFCTKLAPEYEKAAKELKKGGGPPLASLDSEFGPEVVQKLGIQRFPTVLWFWKGQNVLELPRASEKPAAKIVEWARWAHSPAVQELDSKAEFDEALSTLRSSLHAKARLMVAFNKAGSEGMREAFEAAAQRHHATTVFLYIKEAATAGPTLKSYGQEVAHDEEYHGAAAAEEVIEFVRATLEKAKPAEKEAVEEPKAAKTKAVEGLQNALKNAEAENAEEEATDDGKE